MRHESEEWAAQMEAGMALLSSGDWEGASTVFARVRKEAPSRLARTIATNNLAWTNLMTGAPSAANEALKLANEALQAMDVEGSRPDYVENMRGTLAFALIRTGDIGTGLALIEEVLAGGTNDPRQLALRLCVRAIGRARAGDPETARSMIRRARKVDSRCQLLTEAIDSVGARSIPVPPALQDLEPLIDRFGLSDDVARGRVVTDATDEELNDLLGAVTAEVLQQVNEYLDQTLDAERALPYGDLAQAAIEARLELEQRGERRI